MHRDPITPPVGHHVKTCSPFTDGLNVNVAAIFLKGNSLDDIKMADTKKENSVPSIKSIQTSTLELIFDLKIQYHYV